MSQEVDNNGWPVENPPAFPRPYSRQVTSAGIADVESQAGMTLRDFFAAHALAGMISNEHWNRVQLERAGVPDGRSPEVGAVAAYLYADAMLKERNKRG